MFAYLISKHGVFKFEKNACFNNFLTHTIYNKMHYFKIIRSMKLNIKKQLNINFPCQMRIVYDSLMFTAVSFLSPVRTQILIPAFLNVI